jgi:putative membrane protein
LQVRCHVRFTWDGAVATALVASGVVYAGAVWRLWRRAGVGRGARWRDVTCFAAGWAVLLVALVSPLDALSDLLFAAHMTQHELLMLVAAPLIVLGRPLAVLPWLLPRALRHRLRRVQQPSLMAAWRRLTAPVTVLVLHGLIVWIAHVPSLFEAALAHDGVHAMQHLLFFWSAALFWWALVHGRYGRLGYGVSVLFVFATALHTSALGALLTFSPTVWYPTYRDTASGSVGGALGDQQLAGLLMWIPAGALFTLIGLALFGAWIGEASRRAPSRHWHPL